jgi:hypothetical protein
VNRRDRQPGIFYFHPWEIDAEQPRIAGAGWRSRLRHYTNLSRMRGDVDLLLRDFAWGRMDQVYASILTDGQTAQTDVATAAARCIPERSASGQLATA